MDFVRKHFVGIDLGTTNTLASWSTENHKGEIVTDVLKIDMQDITGIVKSELLPSYIFFDEKGKPVIGKKAKSMISRQPDRVIKNAKSYMGTNKVFSIGQKEVTPIEVSAMILKYIGKAVERHFGEYPKDVIITVPASFDTDKRSATLKAADLAGFNVKEKDGNYKNILLSEPRAALYDYVNLQNKNAIPSTIDFRESKNIVVFDLGGGTLDVSTHSLTYNNSGDIDIKDLGVSRYTEVGGTDFDKLVGKYLMEKFIDKHSIKNIDGFDRNYLADSFEEFAEEIKLDLDSTIENEKIFGSGDDINEIESELFKTGIYKGYNFSYSMNINEYKNVVSKLLAQELTLDNLEGLDKITDTENIIYPILDSLKKAEDKIGGKLKVDAIILNGGMTKFHLIQERVESFFGVKAHSVLDQDKSVARGASVYNYRINNGEVFEKIQNDTIGLQRNGGVVHHLIGAGTVLPTTKSISDFVISQNSVSFIDLPFYLGRREDIELPNRKIAERRVYFKEPLNRGESVSLDIKVDEMGIMEIAGTAGKKKQSFTVQISTDGEIEKEVKVSGQVLKNTVEPQKFIPTGGFIEIDRVLSDFVSLCTKHDKLKIDSQKAEIIRRVKKIERDVQNAINGKHFLQALIQRYPTFINYAKERATLLLGDLGKLYKEERESIQRIFEQNLDLLQIATGGHDKLVKALSGYFRFSIEGLRKIEANISDEKMLTDYIGNPLLKAVEPCLIMTVGATCKSLESLDTIKTALKRCQSDSSYWAFGKFGSRERKYIVPINLLENEAREIAGKLSTIKGKEVLRSAVYCLTEICDRRGAGDKISKELADYVLNSLNLVTDKNQTIIKIVDVCKTVLNGELLTEEQNKVLLDLRVFL
ncbi:MAG: Hsp70 family protein [Cetobacterium sp.]